MNIFIIGLGRFGTVLAELFRDDHTVYVWSKSDKRAQAQALGVSWVDLETGLEQADVIFYCVPISQFEQVFLSHKELLEKLSSKLIIDIQSVKVAPKRVLEEHLPSHHQALLTHPIFGPDSIRERGLTGMKIVIDQFRTDDTTYSFWKNYFTKKGLEVIELSAEEHDKHAAMSQGVVFFIGRVLEDFGYGKTPVDTYWAEQLYKIVYGAVANDSWELFTDLQTYNPYTKQMRLKLGESLDRIYDKLLPERVDEEKVTIGIQGGEGSFTHQTALSYLADNQIKDYTIKYLYTSQKVLENLHAGEIDLGLMAIHNSVGGIVEETVQALAQHTCTIVEEMQVSIRHFLMKHKGTNTGDITTVMAHPQVLKQCRQTLAQKYPEITFTSGEGDLIDHSAVAQALKTGAIDTTIGVMGPEALATIYDLEIIDKDLQDSTDNQTSFLVVGR